MKVGNDLVYHYTTMEGLEGILGGNCLWASHITSLNDASESTYALSLADAAVQYFIETHELRADVLVKAFQELAERQDAFILSASVEGDLLNQWMHYGNDGVAVGLSRNSPLTLSDGLGGAVWGSGGPVISGAEGAFWRRVEYAPDDAAILLDDLGDEVRQYYYSHELTEAEVVPIVARFQRTRMYWVKHPAFAPEKEVRIAAPRLSGASVNTRQSRGRSVEYVELTGAGLALPVKTVVCGPGARSSQHGKVREVERLLASYGLSDVRVAASTIPYVPRR